MNARGQGGVKGLSLTESTPWSRLLNSPWAQPRNERAAKLPKEKRKTDSMEKNNPQKTTRDLQLLEDEITDEGPLTLKQDRPERDRVKKSLWTSWAYSR